MPTHFMPTRSILHTDPHLKSQISKYNKKNIKKSMTSLLDQFCLVCLHTVCLRSMTHSMPHSMPIQYA